MRLEEVIVGTLMLHPELRPNLQIKREWLQGDYKPYVEFILDQLEKKPNIKPNVALLDGLSPLGITECLQFQDPEALEMVGDMMRERWMEKTFTETITSALTDRSGDVHQDVENVLRKLNAMMDNALEAEKVHIAEVSGQALDFVAERMDKYRSGEDLVGIPSGHSRLDAHTGGFSEGDLVVVAGRAGMGKTTFALDMAMGAANDGCTVDIYSLEMSVEQIVTKMGTQKAGMDLKSAWQGTLKDDEFNRLAESVGVMNKQPIFLHTKKMRWAEIKASARRINAAYDTKMIVIDYLQLIQGDKRKQNREQQVAEISREVKLLAKELDCVIVSLSQLSRAVETRADKRPLLSDLRESGAIEQDADMVIFPFRPSYYDQDNPEHYGVELKIAKYRMGETITINPPDEAYPNGGQFISGSFMSRAL